MHKDKVTNFPAIYLADSPLADAPAELSRMKIPTTLAMAPRTISRRSLLVGLAAIANTSIFCWRRGKTPELSSISGMAEFDLPKIAVWTIGCPLFDWIHLPLGTGVARAIVTEGLATAESRPRSIQTLEEFSTAGYDGGFMLIQSIGPQDEAEFDLAKFDAMRTRFL